MLNCRCYLITRVPKWNNRNSNRSLQFQCLRCFHSCDIKENIVDKKTTQFRFFILLFPISLEHSFTPFHTHEIPEPSLPHQNHHSLPRLIKIIEISTTIQPHSQFIYCIYSPSIFIEKILIFDKWEGVQILSSHFPRQSSFIWNPWISLIQALLSDVTNIDKSVFCLIF